MHRKNTSLFPCYCKRNYTLLSSTIIWASSFSKALYYDVTLLWLVPSSSTLIFQYPMVFAAYT